MNQRTFETITRMREGGGHFVAAIGEAASRADSRNLKRLMGAFPELFAAYAPALDLNAVRKAGYDACREDVPRAANPFQGEAGVVWDLGWSHSLRDMCPVADDPADDWMHGIRRGC